MAAHKKLKPNLPKDIPLHELELDDACGNLTGITLSGKSLEVCQKEIHKEVVDREAKNGHKTAQLETSKLVKSSRSCRAIKRYSQSEFNGFIKVFNHDEIIEENAKRRLQQMHGKYIFTNKNGNCQPIPTILNLMMVWNTPEVKAVMGENHLMTPVNIQTFINLKISKKMAEVPYSTISSKTTEIFMALREGINGKCNTGLIQRKKEKEGSAGPYMYILNPEIYKQDFNTMINHIKKDAEDRKKIRASSKKKREAAAAEKSAKIKAAEEAEKKAAKAEAKKIKDAEEQAAKIIASNKPDDEKLVEKIGINTEEELRTFISTHPKVNFTEKEIGDLKLTSYPLIQAIMYVGYMKGAEDEREKPNLVATAPPEEDDFGIIEVDESEIKTQPNKDDILLKLISKVPRGSRIIQDPDGTIQIIK